MDSLFVRWEEWGLQTPALDVQQPSFLLELDSLAASQQAAAAPGWLRLADEHWERLPGALQVSSLCKLILCCCLRWMCSRPARESIWTALLPASGLLQRLAGCGWHMHAGSSYQGLCR